MSAPDTGSETSGHPGIPDRLLAEPIRVKEWA
jgi:hypothetical protein